MINLLTKLDTRERDHKAKWFKAYYLPMVKREAKQLLSDYHKPLFISKFL